MSYPQRYSLVLSSLEYKIHILKDTLEQIDKFTQKFDDQYQMFAYIFDHIDSFPFDDLTKRKMMEIKDRNSSKFFSVSYNYDGVKETDILYSEHTRIKEVRCYLYYVLSDNKSYIEEVLLTDYNKKILLSKERTKHILPSVISYLNHSSEIIDDEVIKAHLKLFYENIYMSDSKHTTDYKTSRMGYVDSMSYIRRHNLIGKINNIHDFDQLKEKPKKLVKTYNGLEQINL